jgi:hypothetical protein
LGGGIGGARGRADLSQIAVLLRWDPRQVQILRLV